MQIFVATFRSSWSPEDDCILGVFSSPEKAEVVIEESMKLDAREYPLHPRRYQQRRQYYNIAEMTLDQEN